MQRWSICAAAVLMLGCTDTASSAMSGAAPSPPALSSPTSIARNCMSDRGVDYPAYARTIDILRRSGEIERATAHFAAMRESIQGPLVSRSPGAAADVALVLDPLFSEAAVRKQAVCDFTQHSRTAQTVEAWDAWVSDPASRTIHVRMIEDASPASPPRIDGARRALLQRLWIATGRIDVAAAKRISMAHARSLAEKALDPAAGGLPVHQVASPSAETEQAGVDRLAARLAAVSERDLERFLVFAESEPGLAFYRSLAATYTDAMRDWYGQLEVETRTKIAPKVVLLGADAVAAQLADIRKALDHLNTPYDLNPLGPKLDNLALREPDNAELMTLRGWYGVEGFAQYEMHMRPREKGQIRDAEIDPKSAIFQGYERPVPFLQSAMALAPKNAEARALLGRVRFVQSKDDEAARLFAEARHLNADDPMLALFEGDLAYVKGQFAKAERSYRAAISGADERPVTRYRAIRHLGFALEAQGRGREFAALAEEQLRRHPEMWALRQDYANDLLDRSGSAAEAMAVLAPIPKTWEPDGIRDVLTRVQLQRVTEAPPAARADLAKRWEATAFDTEAVGKALCVARDRSALQAILHARGIQEVGVHIGRAMLGCAVQQGRPEAVAEALPLMLDINEPLNTLWQDSALCGAAERSDARILTLLLKAKADPERPCSDGKTPQERLAARVAQNKPGAADALAAFDRQRQAN